MAEEDDLDNLDDCVATAFRPQVVADAERSLEAEQVHSDSRPAARRGAPRRRGRTDDTRDRLPDRGLAVLGPEPRRATPRQRSRSRQIRRFALPHGWSRRSHRGSVRTLMVRRESHARPPKRCTSRVSFGALFCTVTRSADRQFCVLWRSVAVVLAAHQARTLLRRLLWLRADDHPGRA